MRKGLEIQVRRVNVSKDKGVVNSQRFVFRRKAHAIFTVKTPAQPLWTIRPLPIYHPEFRKGNPWVLEVQGSMAEVFARSADLAFQRAIELFFI